MAQPVIDSEADFKLLVFWNIEKRKAILIEGPLSAVKIKFSAGCMPADRLS